MQVNRKPIDQLYFKNLRMHWGKIQNPKIKKIK